MAGRRNRVREPPDSAHGRGAGDRAAFRRLPGIEVSGSFFDDYDVAPDGEHFLVLGRSSEEEGITLEVVTGWFEELRAIARERY